MKPTILAAIAIVAAVAMAGPVTAFVSPVSPIDAAQPDHRLTLPFVGR